MHCNDCGEKIDELAKTCPSCGAAVPEQEPADQTADSASYETTKLGNEEAGDEVSAEVVASETQEPETQESETQESETQEAAPAGQTVSSSPNVKRPATRAAKKSGVGVGKIIVALLVVGIIGLGVWIYLKFSGPTPVKLTARDMELLINEALDPSQRQMISSNDTQKKELAKQLKQILALAYEAEKRGLEKRPQVRSEIELRTDQALGVVYRKKNPAAKVSDEEVTAYLEANQKEYDQFLEENPQIKKMAGQADEEMKKEFAKIKVMAERARQDGLDQEEGAKLLILLQRSQALAGAYLTELQKPDIEQYYNEHKSELGQVRARHILIKTDPHDEGETPGGKEAARKKAQSLLERVRNGEDFASIAQEHSDDEASKPDGGDLGFFTRGSMVPQFDQAAFALKPGEVSDLVETQYGFHIIKVEEQREPSLDDPEFQDQIAMKLDRSALEKKIEEIAAASKVEVAEDFKIDAPAPQAPPAFPQGQGNPF
ncbi:MAG TPA: peptidylprolyl isomerase [Blastocatellia bacterium]|nr:peptidylprolyl isomerase [Blastocatellia bacterium]